MIERINLRLVRRIGLAILIAIVAALFVWFGVTGSDLGLNLATEATGILVTVVVIDGLLALDRARERENLRRVAVRTLRRPIASHASLLLNIYKATTLRAPSSIRVPVQSILNAGITEILQQLDFNAPAPVHPPRAWREHLAVESAACKRAVEEELQKYASFLTPSDLDLIQRFLDSSVLELLPKLINLNAGDPRPFPALGATNMRGILDDHLQRLTAVLELLDSYGAEPVLISASQWAENVAPSIGSGRADRKRDLPVA